MHIETKILCVKKEIKRRKKFYPSLVEQEKMTVEIMDREISAMQGVLETLTQLRGIVEG